MYRRMGLWFAVVLAVGGCVSRQSSTASGGSTPQELEPPPDLVAQTRPPIADLPVPVVFDLDQGKSRSFEAAGARWIHHVYYGRADKFLVKRFYERHMPICRWAMVTDMFLTGVIQMDFEKETERCRITIAESGMFSSLQVTVAVWTSGPLRSGPAVGDSRKK